MQNCWTWPHDTTTDYSTHKRMAPAATDYKEYAMHLHPRTGMPSAQTTNTA